MRLALFSDIHGNLEAFKQVLLDISRQRDIAGCYFLGDAISYGPEPDACVKLLQKEQIPCILGNHELALIRPEARAYFNQITRKHFAQAITLLTKSSREFISTWPARRQEKDMLLVHGCPPDSISTYLFDLQEPELLQALNSMGSSSVAFVGHTHELKIIQNTEQGLLQQDLSEGSFSLSCAKALINVGSVGQPRDGDNRAKYILWDPDKRQLQVRYVKYDIKKTVQKILNLGFPSFYANRLW